MDRDLIKDLIRKNKVIDKMDKCFLKHS